MRKHTLKRTYRAAQKRSFSESSEREVVVGRVFYYRGESLVAPLDDRHRQTIRLPDRPPEKIAEGKIVAVSVLTPPGPYEFPRGELIEVLGDPGDPEIQYRVVCHTLQIPLEFPPEVLEEAERARAPRQPEIRRRRDLREESLVTIDGETARDFDDAVSIIRLEDGRFRLGVHIADVDHYVPLDSALDREAFRRGTSVYFPDRAVPMLPPRLSSHLCSLKPRVDRLAVSVLMEVDRRGEVLKADFFPSVIRTRERMTYTAVKAVIEEREPARRERYRDLVERFEWMEELCEILMDKRSRRGALDFDLPEAEIEYDLHGGVLGIVRAERNKAHRIIEEFMLLANETVAACLEERGVPSLYRIHEEPDPLKVESFLEVAVRFGYGMETRSGGKFLPRDFQKLTQKLQGKTEEAFLSYLMLRSFKQARYSEVNQGHFGLASDLYTHFTSPIRRYPDLMVHRLLKGTMEAESSRSGGDDLVGRLAEVASQSSDRERRAMQAERRIMRWLMARFMSERLGEEFDGFIVGMKQNGFFVELLEHFVEGFVPVETLWDDYYIFDRRHYCLIGEATRRAYRLGDRIRVRVDKVNVDRGLIDFSEVVSQPPARKRRRR